MNRAVRLVLIVLGALIALAAGLTWGIVTLGDEVQQLRWDKPWWLLALALVPIVLVLGTVAEDGRVPRLRVGSLGAAQATPSGWRARLRDVPGVLRAAALGLITIALARPQSLAAAETDERSGIDIMLAIDLSGSMRAADLRPTRVEAAKAVVQEFIERRPNDRIGAVVFAKEAFLLTPLTFDHVRVGQLVGKMQIGVISGDGTAIGDGLATALARLRKSKASTKVVVLLTDGDNNAGSLGPEKATAFAKELGVKVYTVQMGNGDEVDVEVDKDAFGRPVYGRARFPVNPQLLESIAKETGAEAYIATHSEELRSSMHAILDSLAKTRFEAASSDVVERFPLALFPGVALVVLEALLRALVLRRFP